MTNPSDYDQPGSAVPDPTPVGPASVVPVEPIDPADPVVKPPKKGFQITEIKKTIVTALGFLVAAGGVILPYVSDVSPEVGNTAAAVVGIATIVLNWLSKNTSEDPLRVAGRSVALMQPKRS